MTSKIKVDNINKVSDDTNIIKKCGSTTTVGSGSGTIVVDGSTVTLGRCGGTVALASGATQTGFGRTGAVDWQTSIKTSTFTAANGEGYFIDTSSGAVTVNLPSASVGNIVAIKDYAGTFQTNNLTITPNGSDKIDSTNGDAIISTENAALTLVFADSTRGWLNVNDSTNVEGASFVSATGGSITTVCTNFKVHTFTGPGTFQVTAGSGPLAVVDYLVIAGGGGGGTSGAGGAGAGGYRESKVAATSGCWTASPLAATTSLPVAVNSYPITVGAGGTVNPAPGSGGIAGNNGANSVFSTITSAGGGYGGGRAPSIGPVTNGGPGGSGGGGSWDIPGTGSSSTGGTGNTPPVNPPQGFPGGTGKHNGPTHSTPGGGGGAGGPGPSEGSGGPAGYGTGDGAPGIASSITSSPVTRAGGGGGESSYGGNGGPGGGGDGAPGTPTPARAGTANTGGGGGGGPSSPNPSAGVGGSGIVIIRYKFQ